MLIEIPEDIMRGKKIPLTPTANTWIAGGAVRAWYVGKEKRSDIDVFTKDEKSAKAFCEAWGLKSPKSEHANATTYQWGNEKVQVMKIYRKSPEETLKQFDYSVCQFAWDGTKVYATIEAIDSVLRNRISVISVQQGFEFDSLRRAFKYARKGYWPCLGCLRDLLRAMTSASPESLNEQMTRIATISLD